MRLRSTTLSPLLRCLAGVTLFVFVMAQAACFTHCHFGGGGHGARPSCHGPRIAKASPDNHGPVAPSAPSSSATCATLKTLMAGGDSYTVALPVLQPVPFLDSPELPLGASLTAPQSGFLRPAFPRDRVFTPAVCLGPALRSLAPPISA